MFLLKLKKRVQILKKPTIVLTWIENIHNDLLLQPVNYTHLNKSHNYNNKKTAMYSTTIILFSDFELKKKKSKDYMNMKKLFILE